MASVCAGCTHKLPHREFLCCAVCHEKYDLECANVSSKRFYNTMSAESKTTWKCQTCRSKMPKTGNINTPIRPSDPEKMQESQNSSAQRELSNVTMRQKINLINISSSSDDLSVLGDTQNTSSNQSAPEITLQTLSQVISTKLEENNKFIISELQNVIQMTIQKAITNLRLELKKDVSALFEQNELRKTEIQVINSKVEDLEIQYKTLQNEIKKLECKLTEENVLLYAQHVPENNNKKIVIYGLEEYSKETDSELHSRVIAIFDDILQLNTMGYIEDIHRVGRRNNRNRPLAVELISKRMVKYILQNSNYFQGTGLSISEFLNAKERHQRAYMREEMFSARRKGLHAIIRNNKLVIDGKIIDLKENDIQQIQNINTEVESKPENHENKNRQETNSKEGKNHSFRN